MHIEPFKSRKYRIDKRMNYHRSDFITRLENKENLYINKIIVTVDYVQNRARPVWYSNDKIKYDLNLLSDSFAHKFTAKNSPKTDNHHKIILYKWTNVINIVHFYNTSNIGILNFSIVFELDRLYHQNDQQTENSFNLIVKTTV